MPGRNHFLNGVAELLILSILKEKDTYSYDIQKVVSKMSKEKLLLSQNTIYAAAYKLERAGKITHYSKLVGEKRTRVYYHIEDTGLEYLTELLSGYQTVTTNVEKFLNL